MVEEKKISISKEAEPSKASSALWSPVFIIIACIVIASVIIYLAWRNHKVFEATVITQSEQQMLSIVKTTARHIEDFIDKTMRELRTASKIPKIKDAVEKSMLIQFQDGRREYYPSDTLYENFDEKVNIFYILDKNGMILDRIPFSKERIGKSLAERPGVKYVLKHHKPHVSRMFTINDGTESISIIYPVFKEDKFIGMLRAVTYIESINRLFLLPIEIGKDGYMFLLDDSGLIYYHQGSDFIGRNIKYMVSESLIGEELKEKEVVNSILNGSEGSANILFDEFSDERLSFAWTYVSTVVNESGAVGIKIKLDNARSKDALLKKAKLITTDIDKSIPRLKDLNNPVFLNGVMKKVQAKYPDLVEITIQGPRSEDDDALVYKASTSPGLEGKTSDIGDLAMVKAYNMMFSYTKQDDDRPHAGEDVIDVTSIIHTVDNFLPIVAVRPYSEIVVPIKKDLNATSGFAGLLVVMFFLGSFALYEVQKNKIVLEAEKDNLEIIAKSAEELRESEHKLKTIFNSANDAIFILSKTGRFLDVNDAACKRLGYSRDELSNMTVSDIDPPEFADKVPERLKELREKGQHVFESAHVTKFGRVIPVEISAKTIEYEKEPAIISIIRDITERQEAREELRERNEIISSITSSAHDAIIMIDHEEKITYWNEAAENILEYQRDAAVGCSLSELLIPKRFQERHKYAFKSFLTTGTGVAEGKTMELLVLKKDGSEVPVEVSLSSVNIKGKRNALAILRDITERKIEEEEKRRDYLNLVGVMIVAINKDKKIVFINNTGCEILGYKREEIIGKDWFDNFVSQRESGEAEDIFDKLIAGKMYPYREKENNIINKNGEERLIYWNNSLLTDDEGKVIGILSSGEDITEKKKIQNEKEELWKQLLQSQKMESIGRITGGMAHDFNNILTAIIGYSQLALESLKDSPESSMVKLIKNAADKAAKLINHLLAFSRKQILEMHINDLNEIVSGMGKMLKRVIGEDIILKTEIDPDISLVLSDEVQVEQVLMNLVVNARYAMPDGGTLTIKTKNVKIDDKFIRTHKGAQKGKHVMLSVADTGKGMSEEIKEKIFEPFFTTKEKGAGTGLGLSMVFGIVKQHNGYITVDSKVGEGSVFCIYFPQAEDGEVEEKSDEGTKTLEKGNETIIIVDDDPMILNLAIDILTPLGYDILSAKNGEQALEVIKKADKEISLLVTDVIMPGMNGWELNQEVCRMVSGIKTVFISGYMDSPVLVGKIIKSDLPLVNKPFTPRSLAETIRVTLDGKDMSV